MSHINQSKYIGISKGDSFQYTAIRSLAIALIFLIVVRADIDSTLRAHVPQLILALVYLMYFICADYANSRSNQLAQYFDQALDDYKETYGDSGAAYAERSRRHLVLILMRKDGQGGI